MGWRSSQVHGHNNYAFGLLEQVVKGAIPLEFFLGRQELTKRGHDISLHKGICNQVDETKP